VAWRPVHVLRLAPQVPRAAFEVACQLLDLLGKLLVGESLCLKTHGMRNGCNSLLRQFSRPCRDRLPNPSSRDQRVNQLGVESGRGPPQ
jgi:hypothetical protein